MIRANSTFKQHRLRPLSEHVKDYEQYLKAKGRKAIYVPTTVNRISAILDACRFTFVADIRPSHVQKYLGDLRASGLSISSCNHYVTAMKMFVNWMVKDRRTADNPIVGVAKQNTNIDRRRVRRPLSPEEFEKLLEVTAGGPDIQNISGPDRVILYIVAGYIGYRRDEIGSVTQRSFDFAASPSLYGLPTLPVANRHLLASTPGVTPRYLPVVTHLAKASRMA